MPEIPNHSNSTNRDDLFAERVVRYLNGSLSDEGVEQLNRELVSDSARRKQFVGLCLVESLACEDLAVAPEPTSSEIMAEETWKSSVNVDWPISPPPRRKLAIARRVYGLRWAVAATILLVVGMLAVYRDRWFGSTSTISVVATLTGETTSRWNGPAMKMGAGIENHHPWDLAGGCIELTFAGGATAVVEAPAQFTLESSTAITLTVGKLAAIAKGGNFIVHTPAATLTDLGTEFGVDTRPDGSTRLDVFKGTVSAEPRAGTSPSHKSPASGRLTEGQAAEVARGGITIDPAGAVPQQFVRSLGRAAGPLDVADLIAGGDGTTHRRGMAIDVSNGNSGPLSPVMTLRGDHQYHMARSLTVVDGCFIPDGSSGPTRIDSVGHMFTFPATSNESFNHLWSGGVIPWPEDNSYSPAILDSVDYSQPGHGLLFMHSNKGITLDLNEVRRLHPKNTLKAWSSTVGNSFRHVTGKSAPRADLYMIVDGRSRFEKKGFTNEVTFPVHVALTESDNFLTLAVTDGGDGHNRDWVVIGDPVLELRPR